MKRKVVKKYCDDDTNGFAGIDVFLHSRSGSYLGYSTYYWLSDTDKKWLRSIGEQLCKRFPNHEILLYAEESNWSGRPRERDLEAP